MRCIAVFLDRNGYGVRFRGLGTYVHEELSLRNCELWATTSLLRAAVGINAGGFTVDVQRLERLFVSQVVCCWKDLFIMSNRSSGLVSRCFSYLRMSEPSLVQDRQSLALRKDYIPSCLLLFFIHKLHHEFPYRSCPHLKRIETFGPAHRVCIASRSLTLLLFYSSFSFFFSHFLVYVCPRFSAARDAASVCACVCLKKRK